MHAIPRHPLCRQASERALCHIDFSSVILMCCCCSECSSCRIGTFVSSACSAVADTGCATCDTCSNLQYASQDCANGLNRICTSCESCFIRDPSVRLLCDNDRYKWWAHAHCCYDTDGNQVRFNFKCYSSFLLQIMVFLICLLAGNVQRGGSTKYAHTIAQRQTSLGISRFSSVCFWQSICAGQDVVPVASEISPF